MLRLITIRHRVLRYTREDLTGYQILLRQWRLFDKVTIWSKVIDREDVPNWAFIQKACLGYSDWESRLYKEYAHLIDN